MNGCLSQRLGATWRGFLSGWLPILLVAIAMLGIGALISGAWQAALVGLFAIVGLFLVGLFSMFIADIIICTVENLGFPPADDPSGSSGGPLTGDLDCPTARQALVDAQALLAIAQQDYNNKAVRVRQAQSALSQARTALSVASAGLVFAYFVPVILVAALAAVAASSFFLNRAARELGTATGELNQAALRLGRARQDVAHAEAQVAQACAEVVVPSTPGPGTTYGANRLLSGFHANNMHRG
jgi:hypothetical protein